jgi:hypothetical protein
VDLLDVLRQVSWHYFPLLAPEVSPAAT